MKNYLGEDVQPRKLSFQWNCPHLNILVDGHWLGMVSPNGWQGENMGIHWDFGEPVMNNVHLWSALSLAEMSAIKKEWDSHIDAFRSTLICVGRLSKVKKISFDNALKLLQKKNIKLHQPMSLQEATEYCRIHGIPWGGEP